MPTSADADLLVDTSAAVALVLASHEAHEVTQSALRGRRLGLAGHAAFETFSVLTRLPPPARRSPATVAEVIEVSFPATRFLSADGSRDLARLLLGGEIAGGSVYDALVGATAAEHGLVLATRDRRALDTYRLVGAELMLLAG